MLIDSNESDTIQLRILIGNTIIAPSKWSREYEDGTKDVLPEEWTKIDVKYL